MDIVQKSNSNCECYWNLDCSFSNTGRAWWSEIPGGKQLVQDSYVAMAPCRAYSILNRRPLRNLLPQRWEVQLRACSLRHMYTSVTHQTSEARGYVALLFLRRSCGNYHLRDTSKQNELNEYFQFGTNVIFLHTKKGKHEKRFKLIFRLSLSSWNCRLRHGGGKWWRTNLLVVTRPTWNDRKNEIRNFPTVKKETRLHHAI
jgi:hypothetical protein